MFKVRGSPAFYICARNHGCATGATGNVNLGTSQPTQAELGHTNVYPVLFGWTKARGEALENALRISLSSNRTLSRMRSAPNLGEGKQFVVSPPFPGQMGPTNV